MTRRSSSATTELVARTRRQLGPPGDTLLRWMTPGDGLRRCPIHQCPLLMTENPVDRSMFLACDTYPDCRVTMPPWKAPPPIAEGKAPLLKAPPLAPPPHRGPPGVLPWVIAQQSFSPPPLQAPPPHQEPYAKAPPAALVEHGHHLVVPEDADDV